jgi:hypothetical protein
MGQEDIDLERFGREGKRGKGKGEREVLGDFVESMNGIGAFHCVSTHPTVVLEVR